MVQDGELTDVRQIVRRQVQVRERSKHLDLNAVDVAEALAVHNPECSNNLVLLVEQILLLDQVSNGGDA